MTQPEAATPAAVPPADRAHTVDFLTAALSERISNGEFEVGSWIRQAKLAAEYGVSRTPVTLALSRLEATGVVERIANRGFRIRLPSMLDVVEVLEVRGLLEGHAAARAATRIDQEQLTALFAAVERFREAARIARGDAQGDARTEWHAANTAFHRLVFEASGNHQLEETSDMLHHRMPRNMTWLALGGDPRLLTQNAHEHEAIAVAIDLRDAERARSLTVQHIETASELIVRRLGATG